MGYKFGSPAGRTIISGGGSSGIGRGAEAGSFLKFYTAINGNGFQLPAGVIIERITVTDPNNNPNLIRLFMEGFPEVMLSEMALVNKYAIDQIDHFLTEAKTFYFTGFTASTIATIRFYAHPNF